MLLCGATAVTACADALPACTQSSGIRDRILPDDRYQGRNMMFTVGWVKDASPRFVSIAYLLYFTLLYLLA